MRPVFNPYIAGDPVGKTPAFVGRADVLREVLRVLRHLHQNAIVLYGQRRIGKTSVLQWLEKHLPNEGPYHPVYLDLMNYSGQPLDTLLQDLARAMARALKHPRPVLEGDIQEAFREHFLPRLLDALPAETALVLLMDEFDVQADLDADKEFKKAFFTYMRNLRQVVPRRLQFVFVLGRTIDDLDIVARGLFKDLPAKRVSLLGREDTEDLIRLAERQGSLRWTHPAVETIWDLTHGHPYLVQALCWEVWEALHADGDGDEPPRARKADVEAAVEPMLARSAHMFAWIWEGLGPAEKVAAAALAEAGPGPVSEERLATILAESGVRIVIRELRDALRKLKEWDFLEKGEGGYRFRVELLRRWIAERHPLDRTQDELDRIHPVADNLYQAARGLYERGDLEGARETLERALSLNPSHQGALELLGEIALAQDDLDTAQKALEALLELVPRRARERLVQVYLLRAEATADDGEQEHWYRQALAVASEHPTVRERLMRVYLRRAEVAMDAQTWEQWYRQAQAVAPESPQAQKELQDAAAAHHAAIRQAEHEAILYMAEKEGINVNVDKVVFTEDVRKILSRLDKQTGIWISGAPQAGKTSLLELLKAELKKKKGGIVIHLDGQWFEKLDFSSVDKLYDVTISMLKLKEKEENDIFILIEEFDKFFDQQYHNKIEALLKVWRRLHGNGIRIIVFSYKTYEELRELVGGGLVEFFEPFFMSLWDKKQVRNALIKWGIPKYYISEQVVSMFQSISGGFPVLVKESARIWWERVQEDNGDSNTIVQSEIIKDLRGLDNITQNIWGGLSKECQLVLLYLVWKQELKAALQRHRLLLMEFEDLISRVFPLLRKPTVWEKLERWGIIEKDMLRSALLAEDLRSARWIDWNNLIEDSSKEQTNIWVDIQEYLWDGIQHYAVNLSILRWINLKVLGAYLNYIAGFPLLPTKLMLIKQYGDWKQDVIRVIFGFFLLIVAVMGLSYVFGK